MISIQDSARWRCALIAGVRVGRRHDALHHAEPLVQHLPGKIIIKRGNYGIQNHTFCCANTISVRFKEPTQSNTVIKITPNDTS